MALLFVDGFDTFGTSNDAAAATVDTLEKWQHSGTHSAGTGVECVITGRYGDGMAFKPVNNSNGNDSYTFTPYFSAAATVVAGVAFRIETALATTGVWKEVMAFWSGTITPECGVAIGGTNGRQIRVFRGTTATSIQDSTLTNLITVNRWHYLEFKATIDNSGSFDVYLDGVQVAFSSNSGDTQDTNANCTHVRLRSRATTPTEEAIFIHFDDFYCLNTTGAPDDFLGPQHIRTIMPTATGDSADFTPSTGSNFQQVDDNSSDQDSTYVESSTTGHKDLYNYGDISGGTINAVVNNAIARKTDASSFTIIPVCKSNGVEQDATGILVDNTPLYLPFSGVYLIDPDTTVAWTDAGVNAAQFGYKVG